MKLNLPNKLTLLRIILSIIILLLLGLPTHYFGFSYPTYLLGGKIVLQLNSSSSVVFSSSFKSKMPSSSKGSVL